MMLGLLERLGRQALFCLDPETAHGVSIAALKSGLPVALSYGAMGLEFSVAGFAAAAWRYWREPRRYLPGAGQPSPGYVVRGETEEELMKNAAQHAKEHGIVEVTPELMERVRANIEEE